MRKKVVFTLSMLHGIMIVLGLLTALSALPLALSPDYDLASQFPRALAVFLPFFVTYFASRRCRSIFPYLLFSLFSIVPLLLIPMDLYLRVFAVLLSAWIILVRMIYRVKEDSEYGRAGDPGRVGAGSDAQSIRSAEESGKDLEIQMLSTEKNLDYSASNQRLRKELDVWKPTPMKQAIKELFEYYEAHKEMIDYEILKASK